MIRRDDPRISGLFRDHTLMLRFIAFAMAFMLDEGNRLDQVLAALEDRGMDGGRLVGGKPLSFWIGMSPEQIRQHAGNAAEEILALLSPPAAEPPTVSYAEVPPPTPEPIPNAPVPPPVAAPIPNATTTPKPDPLAEFTIAGYRLSELAGKSDAELLAMPRIGRATITRIREAEAAARQP